MLMRCARREAASLRQRSGNNTPCRIREWRARLTYVKAKEIRDRSERDRLLCRRDAGFGAAALFGALLERATVCEKRVCRESSATRR